MSHQQRGTSSSLGLPIAPLCLLLGLRLLSPRTHLWGGRGREGMPDPSSPRWWLSGPRSLVHLQEKGARRLGVADGEGWQLLGDGSWRPMGARRRSSSRRMGMKG